MIFRGQMSGSRSQQGARAFFAIAAIVLQPPFGAVEERIQKSNPWRAFHDDGPVLIVARAQRVPISAGKTGPLTCNAWTRALASEVEGKALLSLAHEDWDKAVEVWLPWREDDLRAINECSKMPCDVKLNAYETLLMASVAAPLRNSKFFSVVLERVQGYQKTQDRKEYEFPGKPVDPWKFLDTMGFKGGISLPEKMELWIRTLDLAPGRVRSIHQVIDGRSAISADHKEATLWRRDVYTDHYFDSWGEWADVSCSADGTSAVVTEAMLLELDQMKKTDFMSKLMRSKMRGVTEDNGAVHLDAWFEKLRKRAASGS